MLFCNFLRINPKLVVKINRAQIKHFRIRNAILQVGQTLQILRKKKSSVKKLFNVKMAMVSEP